jgi:hypothetical protein
MGSLHVRSCAHGGKLFAADTRLVAAQVGVLQTDTLKTIIESVVEILRSGLK